jgi:hypothetical protein
MKKFYWIILTLLFLQSCGKNSPLNLRKGSGSTTNSSNADEWTPKFNLEFKNELHPLLTQNCGACHSQVAAPFFASPNPEDSAKAILERKIIDFNKASLSRIVRRLKEERHNCGLAAKCDEVGDAINGKIEAILAKIPKKPGTELKNTTPELSLDQVVPVERRLVSPGFIVIEKDSYGMLFKTEDAMNFVSFPATATTVSYQASIETVTGFYIWARYRRGDAGSLGVQFSYTNSSDAPVPINSSFTLKNTSNKFEWVLLNTLTTGTANAFQNGKPQSLLLNVTGASVDLDMLVITDVDYLKHGGSPPLIRDVLQFDLSGLGVPDGKIEIAVSLYDPKGSQGYLFDSPKYIGNGKLKIKGLKVLVNGHWNNIHSLFNALDLTVDSNAYLSTQAMTVGKELGKEKDKFSLSFEEISKLE